MYRQRCAYFRNVWNLLEILQLVSSSLVVAFYVIKSKLVLKRISKLKENPFVTVSFQDVIIWNDVENAILAAAVFIATLKLLRMIRFNPHVIMLLKSFRKSRELLASYSVLFVIVFISYAQLGRVALGSSLYRFSTFLRTLAAELLMCLGGNAQFRELQGSNRVLGPFFSFTFVSLMSFIVVNFFVAILNDSYEDAKENTDRQSEEFEMADFIMGKLAAMLGFGKKPPSEQENKYKATTEKGSLPSVKRSPTPRIKPRQISGKLSRIRESSPVKEHNKIPARRNKRPLKHKSKNESRKLINKRQKVPMDNECVSEADEKQMLQKLDTLTAAIAKDAIREDVELLCLIWLLSDEEGKVTSRKSTPKSRDGGERSNISSFSASNSDATDEGWSTVQNEMEKKTDRLGMGSTSHLFGSDKNSGQVTSSDVDDEEFYAEQRLYGTAETLKAAARLPAQEGNCPPQDSFYLRI